MQNTVTEGQVVTLDFQKPHLQELLLPEVLIGDDGSGSKIVQQSKNILKKVKEEINKGDEPAASLNAILEKARVTETSYLQALQVCCKGRNVILKQDPCDVNTNSCSIDVLQLWRGNIDLQFVLDEYSTVMYVCSYMLKGEDKEMGEVLKYVAKESQNEDVRAQLKKIGKAFIG